MIRRRRELETEKTGSGIFVISFQQFETFVKYFCSNYLRNFNPIIQSRRYLHDVITTNHVLLLTLERAAKQSAHGTMGFDMNQHLNQFCSRAILDRYGNALEDFKSNGAFVNNSILTIFHHVGGDLGRADLLCQPDILRPFRKILEEDFTVG